jgi:Fic family protein
MDDFVNIVNRSWETSDPVALCTFVLWRINHIHPFINGNGRTARATCYFVLCVKSGAWLPGQIILPQLLTRERDRYVKALKAADQLGEGGGPDLKDLHALISELLVEQLATVDGRGDVST